MPKRRTPPGSEDASSGEDAAALHDALEFRAAVRDVKPLKAGPPPVGLATKKPRTRVGKPAIVDGLDELMPLLPASPVGSSGAEPMAFQRAGVRTQVVRRLRRGLIPIESELDLHGLSQTAARFQLAEFLAYSRDAGRRCVRVIHGKGHRSGARGPVLKTAVELWLRRHLDVMAFTSARPIDGGTGAVYVLLRA